MAAFLVPNRMVTWCSLPTKYSTLDEEDRKRLELIARAFHKTHAEDSIDIRRRLLHSIQVVVYFIRKSQDRLSLTLDTQRHRWTQFEFFAFWAAYVMSECVSKGDSGARSESGRFQRDIQRPANAT